jgi:hypothetical protein
MKKKPAKWNWPQIRFAELQCPHHVGHGKHIHGCDGCCNEPEFIKKIETIASRKGERYETKRTI